MTVGVLALMGGFVEHISALRDLGISAIEVRTIDDAKKCNAFIIPGGESTVISKLMYSSGLMGYLLDQYTQSNIFIWGTCAGAIICASYLKIIDVSIQRNAYGAQCGSSIIDIYDMQKQSLGSAVLIRAPKFLSADNKSHPIAQNSSGDILAYGSEKCLITSFHPELLSNNKFDWHKWFFEVTVNDNKDFSQLIGL